MKSADFQKTALSWGSHLCHFYKDKEDLLQVLVPYFETGLRQKEYCIYIASDPVSTEMIRRRFRERIPFFEDYENGGQIELLDYDQWYISETGSLQPLDSILNNWLLKEEEALNKGYSGIRVSGNTYWLEKSDFCHFLEYEGVVNRNIKKRRMIALCSYSLEKCDSKDIWAVIHTHKSSLFCRKGKWRSLANADEQLQQTVDLLLAAIETRTRQADERETLVKSIFESSRENISLLDRDGNLLYISPAGKRLFGLNGNGMAGKNVWMDLWGEKSRPMAESALMQALDGESSAFEAASNCPERESAWCESVLTPLKGRNGDTRQVLVVIRDLTPHKEMEDRLHQIQWQLFDINGALERRLRERTALAEKRADEIRNLASVLTLTEQRERRKLAQILHDHLQQILVAAKISLSHLNHEVKEKKRMLSASRVDGLIDEALEASRSLTVELSPPVLQDAGLLGAIEWLSRWVRDKHGLWATVSAEPDLKVPSEEVKIFLFQAVRELLTNVVKHSRTCECSIHLSTSKLGIRMEVSDNGCGLPQAEKEASPVTEGSGLFSIRERLRMLGGRMTLESAEGEGVCVILEAPAAQFSPPVKLHRKTGDKGWSRKDNPIAVTRLLIVDDHKILRQGIGNMLAGKEDLDVVGEASDGEEAIRKVEELMPDLVLMDISMPKMNGIEATRWIKEHFPFIQVIGLSLHDTEDMAVTMKDAGASAYFSKSGPVNQLVNAIRELFPAGEKS